MPFAIYLRKSRKDLEAEARGEGETLKRHEKILLELAKQQKLNITEIYREIVSGETIAARPVVQQLLSEVESKHWEGVLVMEVERLGRGDTIDQGIVARAFSLTNTLIITPFKTYDPSNDMDTEYFEFGLFMSRREYKTINRRLQTGRIQSVKEGRFLGSIAPYGYVKKKLEKQKGYTLEKIFPEEGNPIEIMFYLWTKGEIDSEGINHRFGLAKIANRLNALQTKPMKGDVWVPSAIRGILSNPVYAGKIRWNFRPNKKRMVNGQIKKERPRAKSQDWLLVKGLHESYIDWDTFELAQYYLSQIPSRPAPQNLPVKNPLAGLIECGICGRKMVRRPYAKANYPDTLMCPSAACKNISSHLHLVEQRLLLLLENWLKDYRLNWETENKDTHKNIQINITKKGIKRIEEELSNLEKQNANIHDLLEKGVYTTEVFLERSKILSQKITVLQTAKNTLSNKLHHEEIQDKNQKLIIPKIEKIIEVYKITEEPALKNELLSEIVEKAVYTKTAKSHRLHPISTFELDLYPKLPDKKD